MTSYEEKVKELNEKILKITMLIQENHPELSSFLEEMTVTIPDEENPEITFQALQSYYDELKTMLKKYEVEHPEDGSSVA